MPTTEFDNLDIPEFLKLTKEQHAAAWIGAPMRSSLVSLSSVLAFRLRSRLDKQHVSRP
jgi:hypothetical protein